MRADDRRVLIEQRRMEVKKIIQKAKDSGKTAVDYLDSISATAFYEGLLLLEYGNHQERKAIGEMFLFKLIYFCLHYGVDISKEMKDMVCFLIQRYKLSPNAYKTIENINPVKINLLQYLFSSDFNDLKNQCALGLCLINQGGCPDYSLDNDENFLVHKIVPSALKGEIDETQFRDFLRRDDLAKIRLNKKGETVFNFLKIRKNEKSVLIKSILDSHNPPILPNTWSAWCFYFGLMGCQTFLTGISLFDEMKPETRNVSRPLVAPIWVSLAIYFVVFELTVIYPVVQKDYNLIRERACHTKSVERPKDGLREIMGHYMRFLLHFLDTRLLGNAHPGVHWMKKSAFLARILFYFLFFLQQTYSYLTVNEWSLVFVLSMSMLASFSVTASLIYTIGDRYYLDHSLRELKDNDKHEKEPSFMSNGLACMLIFLGAPGATIIYLSTLNRFVTQIFSFSEPDFFIRHSGFFVLGATFLLNFPALLYTSMSYERYRISRSLDYFGKTSTDVFSKITRLSSSCYAFLSRREGALDRYSRFASGRSGEEHPSPDLLGYFFSFIMLAVSAFINVIVFYLIYDKSRDFLSFLSTDGIILKGLSYMMAASTVSVNAGSLSLDLVERTYDLVKQRARIVEQYADSRFSFWRKKKGDEVCPQEEGSVLLGNFDLMLQTASEIDKKACVL